MSSRRLLLAHSSPTPWLAPIVPFSWFQQFWKDFQLETVKTNLDAMGLKIAEHQEQALKARKGLAVATKDFKKITAPEEQSKEVGKLLK